MPRILVDIAPEEGSRRTYTVVTRTAAIARAWCMEARVLHSRTLARRAPEAHYDPPWSALVPEAKLAKVLPARQLARCLAGQRVAVLLPATTLRPWWGLTPEVMP